MRTGGKGKLKLAVQDSIPASAEHDRAEDQLRANTTGCDFPVTESETTRLLQELEIHRIELEMQNIELRQSREETEKTLEKYANLYEFAPVGYLALDRNGVINSVNLRGASIVGVVRAQLLGQRFGRLVAREYRHVFADFICNVFTNGENETCEMALQNKGNSPPIYILLYATTACLGQECGVTLIDITDRKRAEDKISAYQDQLRSMASEISFVEERERLKIAISLHDQIGQTLAMANFKLGELRQAVAPWNLDGQVDAIREMITNVIQHSRTLTFELSPPILYELGLEAAVSSLAERYQKEHGILIDFSDDCLPKPLSKKIRILLFQAVRELVVNAIKHAKPQRITISCQREGADVRVTVEDDGVGFVTADDEVINGKNHGFGLFSLRERLKYLGGSIDIKSAPGRGTLVTMTATLLTDLEIEGETA